MESQRHSAQLLMRSGLYTLVLFYGMCATIPSSSWRILKEILIFLVFWSLLVLKICNLLKTTFGCHTKIYSKEMDKNIFKLLPSIVGLNAIERIFIFYRPVFYDLACIVEKKIGLRLLVSTVTFYHFCAPLYLTGHSGPLNQTK